LGIDDFLFLTNQRASAAQTVPKPGAHERLCRRQPFCACRCFRSELRREIRALATRTASVRDDCFFGSGGGVSAPVVGIMRNCAGAIEPCSTGCMLIGPGGVGWLFGIIDNTRRTELVRCPIGALPA
jgi:hypothetical protein